MIATISTTFRTTDEKLWKEISKPSSLQYVSSPLLSFVSIGNTTFGHEWELDKPYTLKLFFLHVVPLGNHTIVLKQIDRSKNLIVSQETGSLAKIWNHTIHFENLNDQELKYTDTIEIKGGMLTPVIGLFARLFYRHRQARWKFLLANTARSVSQD